MFRYSAFALSIHSEVELPDLPPGGTQADVMIRFGNVPRTRRLATMDEELALHTHAGAFLIRQGREIILDPLPGVDADLLRVLLVGRMMAFLLRQRGFLPLHASGVALDGRVALFLGDSGSGKSTIAAGFHARGHRIVTDDVGAVRVIAGGKCVVGPAGSRIRLLNDSRSVFEGAEPPGIFQWDKHLFDLAGGTLQELLPVSRIYLLEYGPELRGELVPPLCAVPALSMRSFVKHGRMNKEALAAHLRDCSAVANLVPVFRLIRPHSLQALPLVVRWVEENAKSAWPL
jgi:hypothetical protein